MDKMGLIITCMWSVVIIIGIIMNRFMNEMTSGEYYLCLMVWLYVSLWMVDRNGDGRWRK